MSGILAYGTAIPRRRIAASDIRKVWGNLAESFIDVLSIGERAVLGPDEDTLTLAVAAARRCLERAGDGAARSVGAVLLGTGTSPYATKAAADVLKDALDLSPSVLACDVQCAERSGSVALALARGLVESGARETVLVVAADTPNRHCAPGLVTEYVAGAGACAVLVGRAPGIAELGAYVTHSWDQNDYFRVEGERYVQSGAGFYGWVANWGLLDHVVPAFAEFLAAAGAKVEDFDKFVVPQRTGIRALMAIGKTGLDPMQALPYVLTPMIGDAGAAQSFLVLAHILDWAEPGELVGVADYGSGAGCDVWSVRTTDALAERRPASSTVLSQIEDKVMVDYATMLKLEQKLLRPAGQLSNFY